MLAERLLDHGVEPEQVEPLLAWAKACEQHHPRWSELEVVRQIVEVDWPLRNLICGIPVLDVSTPELPPAAALALLRPDATLECVIEDRNRAEWLRQLGYPNVVVHEKWPEDRQYLEVLCRDEREPEEVLKRYRRFSAAGGRRYLVRRRDEGRVPDGALIQTIALGPRCHVLHYGSVPSEPGVEELQQTGRLVLERLAAEGATEFAAAARERLERDEWIEAAEQGYDTPTGNWLRAWNLLREKRHGPRELLTGYQAVSEGGRLLTKTRWEDNGWFVIEARPWDADYFPKAMAALAWGLGLRVRGEGENWEFELDGEAIRARMATGQGVQIGTESEALRDRLFLGLQRTRC